MKQIPRLLFGDLQTNNLFINLSLLALRFYTGITIGKAGMDKLPLPDWMTEQVASMNFPTPEVFAFLASFSEYAFGLCLALGLFTRFSGIMIAIVMAVASFGFQDVLPFFDMHIAQHYVWAALVLAATGAGKFSIDHLLRSKEGTMNKLFWQLGIPVLLALFGYGIYQQLSGAVNQGEVQQELTIESINIPGSFNDWDPSANAMQKQEDGTYQLKQSFNEAGVIQFKFTINESWDNNFGEEDEMSKGLNQTGTAEQNAENIQVYIPEAGDYTFIVNPETYEYEVRN